MSRKKLILQGVYWLFFGLKIAHSTKKKKKKNTLTSHYNPFVFVIFCDVLPTAPPFYFEPHVINGRPLRPVVSR